MAAPAYTYGVERVDRVIDGDTLKLVVDVGFGMTFKWSFRLSGVNCPEMNTDDGRRAAEAASDWLRAHPKLVVRTFAVPEKYGRWLAIVEPASELPGPVESLNDWLVANSYAVPYSTLR